MRFIDSFTSNYNGFQLDIVGFLVCRPPLRVYTRTNTLHKAILGEGSLDPIAQVITLSNFAYLPRLLPAPQTFLRTSRPDRLETTSTAQVIGITSGNSGENIHVSAATNITRLPQPHHIPSVAVKSRLTESSTLPTLCIEGTN